MHIPHSKERRSGHTLIELVAASVASAMLLAGLGSVMFIAREIAYTPTSSVHRTETAEVVNQISDELRYATLVIQQAPRILEFVVADRDGDGTAEKIRYEWSGTTGAPLRRTQNGGTPVDVLDSVNAWSATYVSVPQTTVIKTTVESAEQLLLSNSTILSGSDRDITATEFSAQQILPSAFSSVPGSTLCWNATKLDFYSRQEGSASETLLVQLRDAGEPNNSPTSRVIGQVSMPESTLTSSYGWNTAIFPAPIRNLSLNRAYVVAWAGLGVGKAAKLRVNDSFPTGVFESNDAGATWIPMPSRQVYGRLYGTFTTPGPTYDVTQNFATHANVTLQSDTSSHARVDASIPLVNRPELIAKFWRADFNHNPTTSNTNGDGATDWVLASGTFDPATLIGGVWYSTGALQSRPFHDFTSPTFVEASCRNSTVGGNGAVLRINADRQGGQYAPLLVYVRRQADGTQSLSLHGKPNDASTKQLFARSGLASSFVRFRLTILPQYDAVNLTINDEVQGTFTYPTYAPSTTTDRYVTLYADTSLAEFDYVDVRVAN